VISANDAALKQFFGDHMLRTVEAGPVHVPVEQTFKAMFGP
jgi:hypothetical protein